MARPSAETAEGTLSYGRGMGVLALVYVVFGVSPLYWNLLAGVSSLEMVCHRSLWGFAAVALHMLLTGRRSALAAAFRDRRAVLFISLCAASHLTNWLVYIWAVTNGRLLESSMGHYLAPMFSTLLGFLFLRERPGRLQWAGIACAGAGVLLVAAESGGAPWISLVLAVTTATFAFFRKKAPVGVAPGMFMELALSAPFLWGYLLWLGWTGEGHFLTVGPRMDLLLVGCGLLTVLQQILLTLGVRSVPMTSVGCMQYIHPTVVFLLGVFVMGEPLSWTRLLVFVLIWAGVALYLRGAVAAGRGAREAAS